MRLSVVFVATLAIFVVFTVVLNVDLWSSKFGFKPCNSIYETNFTFSRVINHTKRSVVPHAFNPLDPTTQYKHHPIISEYGFVTARKNKDHLLDWLGTWIDYKYDCSSDTDPVGYAYKLVVPSRRIPCEELMQRSASPI